MMRKAVCQVCCLLVLLQLSIFGAAQDRLDNGVALDRAPHTYFGLGLGALYVVPTLHAHLGFNELLAQSIDLRLGLDLFPNLYGLSADVLYAPERPVEQVEFYGGGGLHVFIVTDAIYGVGLAPVIAALGGSEFDAGTLDFFIELELGLPLTSGLRRVPITEFIDLSPVLFVRAGINIPL